MALELYEHNRKAYDAAAAMLSRCGRAVVVHPTGTGKSYIAFRLIEDHPNAAILWLSPGEDVFKAQVEGLHKQEPGFLLDHVHFYTYAKLMFCTPQQLKEIASLHPACIILDKFHQASAERWGESVRELLKLCPKAKLLGLTATHSRYLDDNRDMVEELFDGHVASEMTLGEAIVRGILPAPRYVTAVFRYENELAKYQARVDSLRSPGVQDVNQKHLDALRWALDQADGLDKVFAKHITERSGKYIVFCSGKDQMDEMLSHVPEWFAGVNPDIRTYSTCSGDLEASGEFAAFRGDQGDHLKLLFCIDMLNESAHPEGISGVILFRPTVSPIVYKQQIGLALTAGTTSEPLILDVINNFEGLSCISDLQKEIDETVHRLYRDGEKDRIITDHFEVIEQARDCRLLFERLESSLSSTWDHYFAQAKIYFAEHGNLRVPLRYKTSGGLSLGDWVQTQRQLRRDSCQSGVLTQQQIDRLDNIGMVWETRAEASWNRGLEAARHYYQRYGNLQIPQKYHDDTGFALGSWFNNIRFRYRSGKLQQSRIDELEAMGVVWSVNDTRWEYCYAEAVRYYEQHGDLECFKRYVTDTGFRLGPWLENQRLSYLKGTLPAEKIRRLEAIGMLWEGRNDRQWQQAYESAKKYFCMHGDLDVPYNYTSPEGIQLGKWIVRQRMMYKGMANHKPLRPERKRLLDDIGMDWREKSSWQKHFEDVCAYQKAYGSLIIPATYRTADGCWLNHWLYSQRQRMRDAPEKLTADQRQKLEMLLGQAERMEQFYAG